MTVRHVGRRPATTSLPKPPKQSRKLLYQSKTKHSAHRQRRAHAHTPETNKTHTLVSGTLLAALRFAVLCFAFLLFLFSPFKNKLNIFLSRSFLETLTQPTIY
jgi:hypothetical protein